MMCEKKIWHFVEGLFIFSLLHLMPSTTSMPDQGAREAHTGYPQGAGGPRGGGADDNFDQLASWPALAHFMEDLSDQDEAGEAAAAHTPVPPMGENLSLARSLSLPTYFGLGASIGGMRDMFPLTRHLRNPNGLHGGGAGGMEGEGPDKGSSAGPAAGGGNELNSRLAAMLAKVRVTPHTHARRPRYRP